MVDSNCSNSLLILKIFDTFNPAVCIITTLYYKVPKYYHYCGDGTSKVNLKPLYPKRFIYQPPRPRLLWLHHTEHCVCVDLLCGVDFFFKLL